MKEKMINEKQFNEAVKKVLAEMAHEFSENREPGMAGFLAGLGKGLVISRAFTELHEELFGEQEEENEDSRKESEESDKVEIHVAKVEMPEILADILGALFDDDEEDDE